MQFEWHRSNRTLRSTFVLLVTGGVLVLHALLYVQLT
jgi:hypothetical protein